MVKLDRLNFSYSQNSKLSAKYRNVLEIQSKAAEKYLIKCGLTYVQEEHFINRS